MSNLVPATGGTILVPKQFRADSLDVVCDQVAQGVPYITACNEDDMLPPPEIVRGWLVGNKEFRERYLRLL